MSAAKRENDPGREALENEFRAMFAERSEMVRVKTAPFAAVRTRIDAARRKRRMRIGSAGVAVAMAVAGVGVWAAAPTRHHAAVAPTSTNTGQGALGDGPAKVLYSDGHTEVTSTLRDAALDWLRANYKGGLSGLTVITTFDRSVQSVAGTASDNGVAVVDSRNGAVLALAGRWQGQLEIGDLMKPVVLAAAFKNYAYTPDSTVPLDTAKHPLYFPVGSSQPLTYMSSQNTVANWPPESPTTNIQDIDVTLRQAAENGANGPFARLSLSPNMSPMAVRDMAVDLGMLDSTQSLVAVPSVALGMAQASPLTMAAVYATLADGGVRHDPRMVAELVGSTGKTVWSAPDTGTPVLAANAANGVTDILHSALMDGTTGTYAGARQGAGSGTWAMAGAADPEKAAWFDGAEGHYVVTVGVSKVDPNGEFLPVAADHHGGPDVGSRLAGPIWASLVQTLRNRG